MGIAAMLAFGVLFQAAADPEGERVAIAHGWLAQSTAIDNPAFQRIITLADWQEFWRRHTKSAAQPPAVDFRQLMVLILPSEVAAGEEVVFAPPGDPKAVGTDVEARLTDEALRIHLTMVVKTGGLPPPGAKSRTLLSLVALRRSSKPVDFQRRSGAEPGVYAAAGKLESLPGALTLKGRLLWNSVEGGTWMLHQGQERYDLHGVPPGYSSSDEVVIQGRVPTGGACIHMCGTRFEVESIRPWKEK